MQDIMPPVGADAQVIQSYGAGGFRIGNAEYSTPVLVLATQTFAWDGQMTMESLAPVLMAFPKPEVLLFGTGKMHVRVDANLCMQLKQQGIGADTMDTGAACRTFNILLGEGRRVAAAMLLSV